MGVGKHCSQTMNNSKHQTFDNEVLISMSELPSPIFVDQPVVVEECDKSIQSTEATGLSSIESCHVNCRTSGNSHPGVDGTNKDGGNKELQNGVNKQYNGHVTLSTIANK